MTEPKKYTIELTEQDLIELHDFLALIEDCPELIDGQYEESEWEVLFRTIEHVRAVTEALIDSNDLLPF